MKLKVIVHEAEEGGFWAEVPALPGCVSQGESMDELMVRLHEAVDGCLAVDIQDIALSASDKVLDIAVLKRLAARISPVCWNAMVGSSPDQW
jgi:predicted RNase H-like HicB family nuclease